MSGASPLAAQKTEQGQAIVEFALIVPLLFLMLIGVVFFAMGFNLQMVLNSAAYEGARAWARNPFAYNQCTPPKCDPLSDSLDQNDFEQQIIPLIKQYVTSSGFDGNKVIIFSENQTERREAIRLFTNDPEIVRLIIYYPYRLPVGSFVSDYLTVKLSASCTLKKG